MTLEFYIENAELIDKFTEAIEEQEKATQSLKRSLEEYEEWLQKQIRSTQEVL